jgi:hypothetical protein
LGLVAKKSPENGAQFLYYFGPLLDALRELGGSGTPDEVVEQIASDLKLPDDLQNELLPSGELRFRNRLRGLVFTSSKRDYWIHQNAAFGASPSVAGLPSSPLSKHVR